METMVSFSLEVQDLDAITILQGKDDAGEVMNTALGLFDKVPFDL